MGTVGDLDWLWVWELFETSNVTERLRLLIGVFEDFNLPKSDSSILAVRFCVTKVVTYVLAEGVASVPGQQLLKNF